MKSLRFLVRGVLVLSVVVCSPVQAGFTETRAAAIDEFLSGCARAIGEDSAYEMHTRARRSGQDVVPFEQFRKTFFASDLWHKELEPQLRAVCRCVDSATVEQLEQATSEAEIARALAQAVARELDPNSRSLRAEDVARCTADFESRLRGGKR